MRFLVIDDSDATRFMLKGMLESLGHSVAAEARDEDEALKAWASSKPEAVTLDLSLASGNGLDLLRSLKGKGLSAKILVVSGNSQDRVRADLKAAGASGFLVKPFTLEELAQAVREI